MASFIRNTFKLFLEFDEIGNITWFVKFNQIIKENKYLATHAVRPKVHRVCTKKNKDGNFSVKFCLFVSVTSFQKILFERETATTILASKAA